jgi:hypothetical protein
VQDAASPVHDNPPPVQDAASPVHDNPPPVQDSVGTVTFFIQTFFIRDNVYTNFLYTGQSLYGTKFIQDKFYTGTKFIRGQSLYEDKVYTGQSSYSDKVYMGTKFIQTFFILYA